MRGFSLVELSIVLVILGLLTGGILAGQSLIRASELRAVTAEQQRFSAAVSTFRDKYFAIPGDFRDATRFWNRTVNAAHCATNSAAPVTTPGTCDGSGDGNTIENAPAGGQSGENAQFWRQLALAGLIEGSYTGYAGASGADHSVGGDNAPRSKLTNAIWVVRNSGVYGGDVNAYARDYGNYFIFGAAVTGAWPYGPVLKPEEAWNIDTKMDDGRPGYGSIIIYYWNNACATGGATQTDLANSVYKLNDTANRCLLFFLKAY